MANVLYLGDSNLSSTAANRASALQRLGHTVIHKDPYKKLDKKINSFLLRPIHYRTGYRFIQLEVLKWIKSIIKVDGKVDVIWVDSGELFGWKCLELLSTVRCPIILYNVDDPTGKRDGKRFDSLIKAITSYNLVVVVRRETKYECESLGAKRVMQVTRSYDEIAHQPFSSLSDIPLQFRSEVAFIGTWMRNEPRDKFLLDLINQQVPLSIWGNNWDKSAYFSRLKFNWKGPNLHGRDYVAAIQGAKICLGLLSKGNRDLHTTRSLEVPYAGGLLCAERTSEHQQMYKENEEAVFWSDVFECADKCKNLLRDKGREEIRIAGMRRVRLLGVGNENVCQDILCSVL